MTVIGMASVERLFDRVESSSKAFTEVMPKWALGAQSVVRGRARGRPGPRAPTGDYNRSIVGDWSPDGSEGQVGTNAAQALRLEYGFTGTDVLERYYDQPAYAHFGPSVDDIMALGEKLSEAEVRRIF